jgi:hypothetical protein
MYLDLIQIHFCVVIFFAKGFVYDGKSALLCGRNRDQFFNRMMERLFLDRLGEVVLLWRRLLSSLWLGVYLKPAGLECKNYKIRGGLKVY